MDKCVIGCSKIRTVFSSKIEEIALILSHIRFGREKM